MRFNIKLNNFAVVHALEALCPSYYGVMRTYYGGMKILKPDNVLSGFNANYYFILGEQWGSNPRPSEPQSDALTN